MEIGKSLFFFTSPIFCLLDIIQPIKMIVINYNTFTMVANVANTIANLVCVLTNRKDTFVRRLIVI